MKNRHWFLVFGLVLIVGLKINAQITGAIIKDAKTVWVEKKLGEFSIDQKVGQLMMIRAHSDLGKDHIDNVKKLIEEHHIGSLCFFQGTPTKQAKLTNEYQQLAKTPLLVAIDGEWGLGMRFKKDVISYPRPLTLGAIRDNQLIYSLGKQVAFDLKRIGIHLNFAPVVDVNNNPNNPVINNRSFGEDKENVSAKSFEFMKGMQDAGVVACAKHFPGHGDTDVDSHYGLPILNFDYNRLDSLEFYPFRVLSDKGVGSVMVAHLHVPSLDSRPNRPTSLSENAIKNILRDSLGFKGLVITDGMEMEAVTKHFPPGVAEAEAILAGNDIICLPRDPIQAIESIKKYINDGFITMDQIDESVSRILGQKYDLGLNISPKLVINDITKDLVTAEGLSLKAKLFEEAITLVRDTNNIIPFFDLNTVKYGTVAFGSSKKTNFQKRVDSYTKAVHFQAPYKLNQETKKRIINGLKNVDRVIVSSVDMSKYARKNFGLSKEYHNFLKEINKDKEVIVVLFGSPYAMKYFEDYATTMVSYTDDSIMQDRTAQAIFGAADIRGKLPVSASSNFNYGEGIQRSNIKRLGFTLPEEVGMSSDSLKEIQKIVDEMIRTKAAPGCQILIAKDGKIIHHKAYGTQDYKKGHDVKLNDLYDVASVTKIAATTISIMQLYDQDQVRLDDNLRNYIEGIDTTNKKDKSIRDMMAHHAGLVGWIPFYKNTINPLSKKKKTLSKYYRQVPSDSFNIQVASNLYLRSDYPDSIFQRIYISELREKTTYRYSDLAFYLMMKVVENKSGMDFNQYCKSHFYDPLGLQTIGFNPRRVHSLNNIIPSEKDDYFRNQTVHGYVHDMGAAMLGGVSGHAGLFSNSYDLAVVMQMLLNGGYYGGRTYFKPQTVLEFTTRFSRSTRRAIGFDMKEINREKRDNMSTSASKSTYGHLGFTGTCTFVDPENNLVYVMLSNRTYPSMVNNKFGRKNYRPRVQSVIYSALEK